MDATFTRRQVSSYQWDTEYVEQHCQFTFEGHGNDFVTSVDYCTRSDTVIISYTFRGDAALNRNSPEDFTEYFVLEHPTKHPSQYTLHDLFVAECRLVLPNEFYADNFTFFDENRLDPHDYLETPISRLPVAQFELHRRLLPHHGN